MGARILVADDSVTIQKVVELTFSKEDFVLEQARNGDEAIRKAKETRADLVLLDLVMPDMSGYDVCAALRTDPVLRSVPVILLAGTFESFDPQRAAQAGANDFVTQQFESQTLVGKVKQLLFAKSMEAKNMGPAARLAAGAVTVTISAAAAAARVAGPRTPDTPPPAEKPPAPVAPPAPEPDELWQLLGEPSAAEPAAARRAEKIEASPADTGAPAGVPTTPEATADLGTHRPSSFVVTSPPPEKPLSGSSRDSKSSLGTALTSARGTYVVGQLIGDGHYGSVYECVGPFDQPYALKMLRPANKPYAVVKEEWALEMKRLESYRHPNIVYIHDAFEQMLRVEMVRKRLEVEPSPKQRQKGLPALSRRGGNHD